MDQLVRAITTDGMVQAVAITSRDLTERARQIHTTLPVATAALGRGPGGGFHDGKCPEGQRGQSDAPDQGRRPSGHRAGRFRQPGECPGLCAAGPM